MTAFNIQHYRILTELKEKHNCLWSFLFFHPLNALRHLRCVIQLLSGPKRYVKVFRYAKNSSTHNQIKHYQNIKNNDSRIKEGAQKLFLLVPQLDKSL